MSEPKGERHALLSGVGDYPAYTHLPALRAPRQDVVELAGVLSDEKRCGFSVTKLHDPDSKMLQIELERLLLTAGAKDLVLFYFSGHGRLGPDGGLHLCTSDSRDDLLHSTTVSLGFVRNIIDKTKAAQVVIVLDCCYSGAARANFKGDVPSLLKTNLASGRGKYLITSSTAIQPSVEQAEDELSLFTKWFIHGIRTDEADHNKDGIITIEEAFRFADQRVARSGHGQRPQSWGFDVTPGDVVIARSVPPDVEVAPLQTSYPDFMMSIQPCLTQGRIIPFLGTALYGTGPLSSFELASALAESAGLETGTPLSIATAAEHVERLYNDRERFLEEFARILVKQTSEVQKLTAYDLVLGMAPPMLIVSATYDRILESLLEEAGRPYVLVSHVLRSADRAHDGKILVVRRGEHPSVDVCAADRFAYDESNDLVIYKILGSPFHSELAPELELDTTLITETDHLTFLGRLENQHMQVPTAFSLPFKKRPLLFLGYALDVWQYRLVVHVFGKNAKHRFAVRQPTSPIEDLCWRRLGADLIFTDPEDFSKAAMSVTAPAQPLDAA